MNVWRGNSCAHHFLAVDQTCKMDDGTRAGIHKEIENAFKDTQSDLLDNLHFMIDSRLESFRQDIHTTQVCLSEDQMAKIEI